MRTSFSLGLVLATLGFGLAAAEDAKPAVAFSGYVDMDFKTLFSKDLQDPNHTYGLEMKLTTTVGIAPNLKAYIYTAAYDGIVPGQGQNVGVPAVLFDGFTLDWETKPGTHVYAGDQIAGQGFFNYYYYKRSAALVSKHYVRGVGFQQGGFYAQTGADLKARDTAVFPGATRTWSTFLKYDYALGGGTLTPSAKYQAGVPGAYPTNVGLSYVAKWGDFTLNAHGGASIDGGRDTATGAKTDPGYTFLLEPIYAAGAWTFSGTLFLNHIGDVPNRAVPKGSYGAYSAFGGFPEDLLAYFEPDYAINAWLTVGSTFEYHNYTRQYVAAVNGTSAGALIGNDEFWIVPTVYLYPGKNVTWLMYGQAYLKGLQSNNTARYPYYQAGSEVIFNF